MLLDTCEFPRSERLRSDKDFKAVYAGKRLTGRFFILHYKPALASGGRKVAFTVSKKVSKSAVERNKLKRRLREIYRCNRSLLPADVWIIIRALPGSQTLGFKEINEEIISVFNSVASKECRNRTDRAL